MKTKATWSELLLKCQNDWIENNICRLFDNTLTHNVLSYMYKTEIINNEIKLYRYNELISTFKYIINLDNETTVYIENDNGYKTHFTLNKKEQKLCHK